MKQYDEAKMAELKQRIESRRNTLEDIYNNISMGGCKDSMVYGIKEQLMQCNAELRLIKHIENNFEGDFLIS